MVWEESIKKQTQLPKATRSSMLPTWECMEDLRCLLVAFPQICSLHLDKYPNSGVMPSRFNTDLAENIICQIRGLYDGNATNPNYSTYCHTINAIVLGQSLTSRNKVSNAGIAIAKPFNIYVHKKL